MRYAMAPLTRTPIGCRIVIAMLIVLSAGGLQPSAGASVRLHKPGRAEQRTIEKLEDQVRDSLLSGNTANLDKVMSDDFVGISSNGTMSDKQQYLRRISTHEHTFSRIDVIERKVRFRTSSAIVTTLANVSGVLDGVAMHGTFRYTRVYERQANGSWVLVNFEATRVSGPTTVSDLHNGTPVKR